MAISEVQLTTWSHQGSVTQSAGTYKTIRDVLDSPNAPYASRSREIFLQGSYGNDTNIYRDSDVDIVMCLTSVYYSNTDDLSEADKARHDANWSTASYSVTTFKSEVLSWLTRNFGNNVRAGKKAIFVPGNSSRRDADVLVCAEHRKYTSYPATGAPRFNEGIAFWTSANQKIVNYPKQHSANCTGKHQATNQWFKPTVRIFKNMRNAMIDAGYLQGGTAPSYFLEGMLWNVPQDQFGGTYQDCVANAINWLHKCDAAKMVCANELHWLLRDNQPVCWNEAEFRTFLGAAVRYWNK